MPFDAGSAVSTLGLDLSGFSGGILKAQGLMSVFPSIVTEFMADPLLALVGIAEEVASTFKEVLIEAVESLTAKFQDLGNAAIKAGVSVGWLSELKDVGGSVNVGLDQITTGFRVLERQADAAIQGNKEAADSFGRLGLSISELTSLSNSPEELFKRVQEGIQGIVNPAERAAEVQRLLGREGTDLLPIFAMSAERVTALGEVYKQLNADVTADDARMGQDVMTLKDVFGAAWEGIQKTLTAPIFKYLSDHLDEIVSQVIDTAQAIRTALAPVGQWIADHLNEIIPLALKVSTVLANVFSAAFLLLAPMILNIIELFLKLADTVAEIVAPALQLLAKALSPIESIMGMINGATGEFSGAEGGSSPGEGRASGGSSIHGSLKATNVTIENINATFDPHEASSSVAAKLLPSLQAAMQKTNAAYEQSVTHARIAMAIGGHRR